MSKVYIYGWECEWEDIRARWVTGMRVGGAQVVVADQNSVMPCIQNAQKRHSKTGDTDGRDVDG